MEKYKKINTVVIDNVLEEDYNQYHADTLVEHIKDGEYLTTSETNLPNFQYIPQTQLEANYKPCKTTLDSLKIEYAELTAKLERINFIAYNNNFIPNDEILIMIEQANHLSKYISALSKRIAILDSIK